MSTATTHRRHSTPASTEEQQRAPHILHSEAWSSPSFSGERLWIVAESEDQVEAFAGKRGLVADIVPSDLRVFEVLVLEDREA